MKFLLVFSWLVIVNAGRAANPVEIFKYPSSVIIELGLEPRCSGTILNIFWLMTSTSCLLNTSHQQLTIRAGSAESISGSGTEHHAANNGIKWHKSHRVQDGIHWYNLAIVKVEEAFHLGDRRFPARLSWKGQKNLEVGQLGVVVGHDSAGHLNAYEAAVVDLDSCRKMYKAAGVKEIPPHTFCIGTSDADVGAAFMVNNRVYGVVSHVQEDCNAKLPVIVSNVTEYLDFIKDQLDTKWW